MSTQDVIEAEIPEAEFLRICLRYTDPRLESQVVHDYTVVVDEISKCLRVLMVVDSPERHGRRGE